jgi:hypothetical protein
MIPVIHGGLNSDLAMMLTTVDFGVSVAVLLYDPI